MMETLKNLQYFVPSDMALLDWLAPYADDALLAELARADSGFGERENLRVLKQIRDRRQIPALLKWNPKEALELTRWSEPDEPRERPETSGRRGHLIRAYACAVLLYAADAPEMQDFVYAENDTLVQLLDSVISLGPEAAECTRCFLLWRTLRLHTHHEETPFFLFALLLLSAALYRPPQDAADLVLLAGLVVSEENRARTGEWVMLHSDDWLLGLTCFNQRHEVWIKLAREILTPHVKQFPEPAASMLRGIADRIAPPGR